MQYDIRLRITYEYDAPVHSGRHVARLMPLESTEEQRMIAGAISVRPTADEHVTRIDFFGNRLEEIVFNESHETIVFSMTSRVERRRLEQELPAAKSLALLADEIAAVGQLDGLSPHHFRRDSARVSLLPQTTAFAKAVLAEGQDCREIVRRVGEALHDYMTYDPSATDVDTPLDEAFSGRHGVCQDFSHIMIACLRGIGIPAGYVSGVLRTTPPPGKARLEGADAMHAWVMAWCGADAGWLEYDPTNATFAGLDHVVIARGRDYSDVAPIKGLMRTSGDQHSAQAVDVIPVQAA